MKRDNLDLNSLEDQRAISRLDRSGMSRLLIEFPEQVARGWELVCEAPALDQLVVCAMGGSAIGGDFLHIYLEVHGFQKLAFVIRGHELPPWVNDRTLVFAVSYSGNTAETLSCLEQALQRKCPLIAVTSGGGSSLAWRRLIVSRSLSFQGGWFPEWLWDISFFPCWEASSGL